MSRLSGKGRGGFVTGTPRKFTIRHNYLLKPYMLEVSVKFYCNSIISECFRASGGGDHFSMKEEDSVNPLMPVGNYSYQFFNCCPRDAVSRTANVERTVRH